VPIGSNPFKEMNAGTGDPLLKKNILLSAKLSIDLF
jgi:hypothetical protein